MKNFFLSFCSLVLICIRSTGQDLIDSATLKCTYKVHYAADSSNPKWLNSEIFHLLIGKRYSSFFSYLTYTADSAFKSDIEGGKISPGELLGNKQIQRKYINGGPYSLYCLYIDNDVDIITVTDKINSIKYIYEEQREKISWIILEDTLTFLSYQCQKATARFKGRNYIAWFTSELPINAGPYKFSGLPGLIIKIYDEKNNYSFECTGVENLDIKKSIVLERKECIPTTRREFRRGLKAQFDNPWESMTNGTGMTIGGRDAEKIKAMLSKGIPYNPIELE